MKKIFIVFIVFLLFPYNIYADELNLAENAKSAIIMEASTGEIIFNKNVHERMAPASMTKIMSMLLIMENIDNGNLKWDEIITASYNASSMGGSQIFLESGEKMTVQDMLRGIAIASGNDATVAMAERIGGTEEGFVKMMNQKVKDLGLKNTNFKNSSGLDAENHYSSAYDMAIMAKELVKYEKVLEFTGTYEGYLREGTDRKFWLVNTNKLVRFYQGVDGLKTGFTDEAGYCLTSTAQKDGMRLITVVMNEADANIRNRETSAMLDYGFNTYSVEKLLSTNSPIGKIEILKGDNIYVDIVPVENINILNKKTENKRIVTYDISLNKVSAPLEIGDIVGKLKIIEDNKVIKEVDITITEPVKKAGIIKLYCRYLKDIIAGSIDL